VKNRIIVTALSVALLLIAIYCVYINSKLDKIVVVDVVKVFNGFEMKKELESRVDVELNEYSAGIDSLNALLDQAIKNKDVTRGEIIEQMLYQQKMQAQQAYEVSNKNINEQVWKRLNPLIDEFSKKNNYRIVLGANGMGSILYNDEAVDRTQELLQFVNSKYQNGK
jgi:outer membrane protein